MQRLVLLTLLCCIYHSCFAGKNDYVCIGNTTLYTDKPHLLVLSNDTDGYIEFETIQRAINKGLSNGNELDVIYYDLSFAITRQVVTATDEYHLGLSLDLINRIRYDNGLKLSDSKQALINYQLGTIYFKKEMSDSSFYFFERATEYGEKSKEYSIQLFCLTQYGDNLLSHYKYVEAFKQYSGALKLALLQDDSGRVISLKCALADVFIETKSLGEAQKIIDELDEKYEAERLLRTFYYLRTKGSLCYIENQFECAKNYYNYLISALAASDGWGPSIPSLLQYDESIKWWLDLNAPKNLDNQSALEFLVNHKPITDWLSLPGLEIFRFNYLVKIWGPTFYTLEEYSTILDSCLASKKRGFNSRTYDFHTTYELFKDIIKDDSILLIKTAQVLEFAKERSIQIGNYRFALNNAELLDTIYSKRNSLKFRELKNQNLFAINVIQDSIRSRNNLNQLTRQILSNIQFENEYNEFRHEERERRNWAYFVAIILFIFYVFVRNKHKSLFQRHLRLAITVSVVFIIETSVLYIEQIIHHFFHGQLFSIWTCKIALGLIVAFIIEKPMKKLFNWIYSFQSLPIDTLEPIVGPTLEKKSGIHESVTAPLPEKKLAVLPIIPKKKHKKNFSKRHWRRSRY